MHDDRPDPTASRPSRLFPAKDEYMMRNVARLAMLGHDRLDDAIDWAVKH